MILLECPDFWLLLEMELWAAEGLPHELDASAAVPGLGCLSSMSPVVLAPEASECLEELLILRTFLKCNKCSFSSW